MIAPSMTTPGGHIFPKCDQQLTGQRHDLDTYFPCEGHRYTVKNSNRDPRGSVIELPASGQNAPLAFLAPSGLAFASVKAARPACGCLDRAEARSDFRPALSRQLRPMVCNIFSDRMMDDLIHAVAVEDGQDLELPALFVPSDSGSSESFRHRPKACPRPDRVLRPAYASPKNSAWLRFERTLWLPGLPPPSRRSAPAALMQPPRTDPASCAGLCAKPREKLGSFGGSGSFIASIRRALGLCEESSQGIENRPRSSRLLNKLKSVYWAYSLKGD